ncbi:MAG: DNA internalization-related competence protein ComEC/Rec2 [Thermoanaerobaculia bacterium]
MKIEQTPAAIPAALFLFAVWVGDRLVSTPVGWLAVGAALAAALRGRTGVRFGALFLGLLCARLQPSAALARFEITRPAEAVGWVAGDWREVAGGASAPLRLDLLRQGERLWIAPPPVRLDLAAGIALPPRGSRVRLRGLPGRSPGFANAHPVAPGTMRLRVKSTRHLIVEQPPSLPMRLLTRLQETVGRPLAECAQRHPGVGYARGLLLGELEDVPANERLAFRRSGLAHLLAVSGMNVALVAGMAAALGSFCRRGVRRALVAAAVLLHLALVGPVPSLLRATLMTAAALLGLALERRTLALQSLAIAATTMAAFDPGLVRDLGFCLSCSATFGLVVLAPATLRRWPGGRHPLAVALAVSWAAQAATLPWALAAFAYVSPAAPLLNLLAVPLAGLLLVGALGWVALALLVPALRELAALPLDLLAVPYRWLPSLPTGPWLCLPLPPSWTLGLALAAVALLAAASPRSARGTLLGALLLTAHPPGRLALHPEVEWVVADVGQGDGALLRRGASAILIDGGGTSRPGAGAGRDFATQVWLPLLAARGISRVETVIVTHGDSDHCAGLVDVANYVPIGEIWGTPELRASRCVQELLALSRAAYRGLAAGDRASSGGLDFEVLGPPRKGTGKDNDRSLVLAVEAEGRRLLFTGDIERRAELELLARSPQTLRCDLLKVAHHGSSTSSGERFLEVARPRLSVISCGVGNRFGHPAAEVVARFDRGGGLTLRTDLLGEIALRWRRGSPLALEFPGSPRAVLPLASE